MEAWVNRLQSHLHIKKVLYFGIPKKLVPPQNSKTVI